MKRIILIFNLAFAVTAAQAQTVMQEWVQFFNAPAGAAGTATAIAVDSNGNVFVTGSSFGIGSGANYATVAYSSAGVALWTNLYNGTGSSDAFAKAVTVDSSGNVFVTGQSVDASGSASYVTIKYTPNVSPLLLRIQKLNNQFV